jgi:hypothetical protein
MKFFTYNPISEYLKNLKIYNPTHTLKKELHEDLVKYFEDM